MRGGIADELPGRVVERQCPNLVGERDLLEAGGEFDAVRAVEGIRDKPGQVPVRLLKPFDLLRAGCSGGAATIGTDPADDERDLLSADTPIQASPPIGVADQRGKIRDPAV